MVPRSLSLATACYSTFYAMPFGSIQDIMKHRERRTKRETLRSRSAVVLGRLTPARSMTSSPPVVANIASSATHSQHRPTGNLTQRSKGTSALHTPTYTKRPQRMRNATRRRRKTHQLCWNEPLAPPSISKPKSCSPCGRRDAAPPMRSSKATPSRGANPPVRYGGALLYTNPIFPGVQPRRPFSTEFRSRTIAS